MGLMREERARPSEPPFPTLRMVNPSQFSDMNQAIPTQSGAPPFWVFCLCAQWCGVCRGYEADFAALQAKFAHVHFVFLDVEDAAVADLLVEADLDVETFPFIVAGSNASLAFSGPVLPQISVLGRMLQDWLDAQQQGTAPTAPYSPDSLALLAGLQAIGKQA